LLQEVLPQDGDLLLGAEVTTGLGHGKFLRESLAANPREGKFQFRPRQNRTTPPPHPEKSTTSSPGVSAAAATRWACAHSSGSNSASRSAGQPGSRPSTSRR